MTSTSSSGSKLLSGTSLECSSITESSHGTALVAVDADPQGNAILIESETSESQFAGRSGRSRRKDRTRSSSRDVQIRRKRASTYHVVVQDSRNECISGKGKSRGGAVVAPPGPGSRGGQSGERDAAPHPYATPRVLTDAGKYLSLIHI